MNFRSQTSHNNYINIPSGPCHARTYTISHSLNILQYSFVKTPIISGQIHILFKAEVIYYRSIIIWLIKDKLKWRIIFLIFTCMTRIFVFHIRCQRDMMIKVLFIELHCLFRRFYFVNVKETVRVEHVLHIANH